MQCDFTRCSISELGRVLSLRFPRASHFRLFEFLPVAVTQMLLMKGWNHLLENLLCFTRTFKRYQSCFNNVYLKKKEGKETNIANTVCVTRFVVLLLLHRTEHFSWKKLMQFHNHMFSACCVPNSALGPTDTKKTCDLFGRSYTDEILLYKKLNQVIKINLWDVWRYMCVCVCVCVCIRSLQSCSTLCDNMDYNPPGCSVHGILQARILEWVAMPSSRGSSQSSDPGIKHMFLMSPALAGRFFSTSATWEAQLYNVIHGRNFKGM